MPPRKATPDKPEAAAPAAPAHRIYQATATFYADGFAVGAGDTVEEGHPVLKGREALFVPFRPRFPVPLAVVPDAPAAPEPAAGDPGTSAGQQTSGLDVAGSVPDSTSGEATGAGENAGGRTVD